MTETLTTPPTLASLPTQLLTAAPAWFWRYASVAAVSFLLVVGGDYYLGSPVTGWVRAWGAQKALTASNPTPDAKLLARIDALEAQAANTVQNWNDINGRFALNESNFKALELVTQYTVGRVGTLENYMADQPAPLKFLPSKPKVKPVPPIKVPPVAPVAPPITLPSDPLVKLGGTP